MPQVRGNAQEKLEDSYRRYFPIIREKCRRMLSDYEESQDVAQETFIRFWKSGLADSESSDVRQATAWIFRTGTHLAIDLLRRKRRRAENSSLEQIGEQLSTQIHLEKACNLESRTFAREQLHQLVHAIPAKEMEVVVLSRVDGLGQKEIAEVLEVSERTIRRILRRFDERLEKWKTGQEMNNG